MTISFRLTKVVPSTEEIQFMEDRLYEHNSAKTRQNDGQLFGFFIRNEQREIIAGLSGWTWAQACQIQTLWVHESLRGQGYGERLLQAAEEEAHARGCKIIFLESYSFQAPAFYQKHGYQLAYQLEDFPPGHQYNFLIKRLS
jgi:GNAT superfamily N-acetyltransferase